MSETTGVSWKFYLKIFLIALVLTGLGFALYYGVYKPTVKAAGDMSTFANYNNKKNAQDTAIITMTNKTKKRNRKRYFIKQSIFAISAL